MAAPKRHISVSTNLHRTGPARTAKAGASRRKERAPLHSTEEAALRESEERYRNLFDNDLTGDFIAKPDGTIVLCNLAFAKIFGFRDAQAAVGANLAALHGPGNSWSAFRRLLQRRKRLHRQERQALRRDGAPLHIVETVIGTFNRRGGLVQIQGYVFDDTERTQAEEQLKQLNATLEERVTARTAELTAASERLHAIMQSALVGILTLDPQGKIESLNPAAALIFGFTRQELLGRNISRLVASPGHPQDEEFLAHYLRTRQDEFTAAGGEAFGRRKDGRGIMLELVVKELVRGGRREFVVMVRDITDRKRLERELLEIGESERQRLGHDLHDGLGQYLHALYYMASLAEKELKTASPRHAQEAGRLAQQLENALELTRGLARGLQPVNAVPEGLMIALRDLAGRTRELYRVDCRFECRAPVLIPRHTAANHLYRIAQEAVNNAMKHAKPTRIRIHLADVAGRVLLTIRDNGIGIRGRVKKRSQGMGLRLMQFRADAIRGSLAVQSHPRGGTEVVCSVTRQAVFAQPD